MLELPLGKLSRGCEWRAGSPGARSHPFCARLLSVCLHMCMGFKCTSLHTCLRIYACCKGSYARFPIWPHESECGEEVSQQMPFLPVVLAGCQWSPAGPPQQERYIRCRTRSAGLMLRHISLPLRLAWHGQVSCSWWHIHDGRMHVAGVLYQALWEPVFVLSGGEHLNTVQRCWCSLLARREVAILFPCPWFLWWDNYLLYLFSITLWFLANYSPVVKLVVIWAGLILRVLWPKIEKGKRDKTAWSTAVDF